MSTFYYVHVEGTPTDSEDEGIPGVYAIEVKSSVDIKDHISAVLDCFHSEIGIATLEDFEITTTDEEGNLLIEDGDSEAMAFEKMADIHGKVDNYPEPKTSAPKS